MNKRSVLFAGALAAALCVLSARAETWIQYRSGPDPRAEPRAYGYPPHVAPYPSGPYGNRVSPPAGAGAYGNERQPAHDGYRNQRRDQAYGDDSGDYRDHQHGRDDEGYRDNRRSTRRWPNGERRDEGRDYYDGRDRRRSQGGVVMRQPPTQRRYPPPAYGPYSAPGDERYGDDSRPYRR